MELVFGTGKVFVAGIRRGVQVGIILQPRDEAHSVGAKDPNWEAGEEYQIKESDVVLWLDSLESARVLQDRINLACLTLGGYNIPLDV